VTGGFVSFADPIAQLLGFNGVRANRLLFDGRQLSGSVENPIVDAQAKLDALVEAREEMGINREEVLAVGDGANDKLMVREAGLGVAFRAKPALVEVADARLDHHGLDALLWAQGIRKRDWVAT
jgi:phosphoserine phosphatase